VQSGIAGRNRYNGIVGCGAINLIAQFIKLIRLAEYRTIGVRRCIVGISPISSTSLSVMVANSISNLRWSPLAQSGP
jgi:hypothetical protein